MDWGGAWRRGLGDDANSRQAGPRAKKWMCGGVSPVVNLCALCFQS